MVLTCILKPSVLLFLTKCSLLEFLCNVAVQAPLKMVQGSFKWNEIINNV